MAGHLRHLRCAAPIRAGNLRPQIPKLQHPMKPAGPKTGNGSAQRSGNQKPPTRRPRRESPQKSRRKSIDLSFLLCALCEMFSVTSVFRSFGPRRTPKNLRGGATTCWELVHSFDVEAALPAANLGVAQTRHWEIKLHHCRTIA